MCIPTFEFQAQIVDKPIFSKGVIAYDNNLADADFFNNFEDDFDDSDIELQSQAFTNDILHYSKELEKVPSDDDENRAYIMDMGVKAMRDILHIFSLLLCKFHPISDNVLGLDDIRVVQPHSPTNDIDPTVIYLTQYAMDSVASKFPYLVWKKLREGQEVRQVAQLDWRIIEDDYDKPFVASGLKFVPLPVMHGEDYICLGFLFGEKSKVAYISDVPHFPSNTEYEHVRVKFAVQIRSHAQKFFSKAYCFEFITRFP
ncbi:hypothetical protein GOBAR_DD05333 [Gossypium barbadense]|nr:hypothetical protein GOBAR_DD05333 [Gossypium barbadense]